MADAYDLRTWPPIQMENQPEVYRERTGVVWMRLPHVPQGWPYQYQWSGITHDAIVDLDRFPILVARVARVMGKSYAHMDIEESDLGGKPAWTERSSTLQQSGLSIGDIGKDHPGVRRLHLRLIVGGPNEGASAAYTYVRLSDARISTS